MKKTFLICMCTLLVAGSVFAAWQIPAGYEAKAQTKKTLSLQEWRANGQAKAAEGNALRTELNSLENQIAAAKLEGRAIDADLWERCAELNAQLNPSRPNEPGSLPSSLDEGGESCATATVITGLPYSDTGYTCDNADDYEADCGSEGGADVFYLFIPPTDMTVTISTCNPGTNFDTKLFITDGGTELACNDDYSAPGCRLPNGAYYRSQIDCIELEANVTYCIGVDGYSDEDCGNYELTVEECVCVECPEGAVRSPEPDCYNGYVDNFNGGCFEIDRGAVTLWEEISCGAIVCGTSGSWEDDNGGWHSDEDWYRIVLTEPAELAVCVDAEGSAEFALFQGPCPVYETIADQYTDDNCASGCFAQCLEPGEYFIAVVVYSSDCGTPYTLSVDCDECACPDGYEFNFVDVSGGLPVCQCLTVECEVGYLCVGPLGPNEQPDDNSIYAAPGCNGSPGLVIPVDPCYEECPPGFVFPDGDWYYDDETSSWCIAYYTLEPGCFCFCLDRVLPVELNEFTAIAGDGAITLNWSTASESDNDYFDVIRDGSILGRVEASNSPTGHSYSWSESDLANGREYSYSLVAVSLTGTRETIATASATPSVTSAAVTEYALHQNYPNPFNPETSISFDIVDAGYVLLTVYNPLGQTVATLVNGSVEAGRHTVSFDGSSLTSGVYFYRIEAGDFASVRKMVLMK